MGYLAPTAACVLATSASIPNASNMAFWFNIVGSGTVPGASALIYDSATSTAGKEVARLAVSACEMSPMIGPYFPASGLFVGNITGGSVNVWYRPTAR